MKPGGARTLKLVGNGVAILILGVWIVGAQEVSGLQGLCETVRSEFHVWRTPRCMGEGELHWNNSRKVLLYIFSIGRGSQILVTSGVLSSVLLVRFPFQTLAYFWVQLSKCGGG